MNFRFRRFLIFSLLFHFLFLLLLQWAPSLVLPQMKPPLEIIMEDYRLADIAPPEKEDRPETAKFAGLYDSRVLEEQVGVTQKEEEEGKRENIEEVEQLHDLYKFDKDLFSDRKETSEFSKKGGKESLEDFFPDYKRGSHTYLNVHRFPDVQYFVRLKRAFNVAFNPESAIAEQMAFHQVMRGNLQTMVGVTIDQKGELAELFVFKTSGISSYDQEVLRTVRVSAPFSSPPDFLVNKEGLLRISWTFTVYLGG